MDKPVRKGWNLLSLIPAAVMLLVIFYFSLQTGEVSTKNSEELGANMSLMIAGITLTPQQLDFVNNLLRVSAHFAEYMLLALCIALACSYNAIYSYLRSVYICGASFFVSLADEFVQIFVPGRYGDPLDVLVDMCGVLIVAALFLKKRRKEQPPRPAGAEVRREFLNLKIDDISFDEALERILSYARKRGEQCRLLVTPNADHVIKVEKDREFAEIFNAADIITTDGTPLLWIADSFGCPIREKITGSDLLPAVCARAAAEACGIFFLASSDELIARATEALRQQYPRLRMLGGYAPPMHFENDSAEVERIVKAVNEAEPDILVVGLGSPKSEKLIMRNRERLHAGVAMPIGAAISFIAGEQKRAPLWMRRMGLEWFYRFLQEPGRLFRRYFIEDMQIFLLALKYRDRTVAGYSGEGES